MHQDIQEDIEIPDKVTVKIEGGIVSMKGPAGEVSRKMGIKIIHSENKIVIAEKNATKHNKKIIKTTAAHIRNMINGVIEGCEYQLQVCSVHFPMNVTSSKDAVLIKNFLGETKERKAKILPNVKVEIKGDIIKVSSPDIEAAGQTAANIESATKVTNKDRRIFQDGVWIIKKAGVENE
jgi:large subunit ribosomal protein L6